MTLDSGQGTSIGGGRGIIGSGKSIWATFTASLALLENFRLVLPLLLYFILKLCVAVLYIAGVREPLTSFWALFLPGAGSEIVSHYPEHLLLMQVILRRLDLLLEIFVHILFQGATIVLVSSAIGRRRPTVGGAFRTAARRYAALIGIAFIAAVAIQICIIVPELVIRRVMGQGAGELATAAAILLGLGAQALFLYAAPAVLISGLGMISAIKKGLVIAKRSFIYTYMLVGLPFVLTVPTLLLSFKTRLIAFRLSPEVLIYILIAGELMQFIATYLITSASAVTFVRRMEETK